MDKIRALSFSLFIEEVMKFFAWFTIKDIKDLTMYFT